jgi:hypothetical protein
MKDLEGFSKWMEEGLKECVIEQKAETCMIAFVLPNGEVMTGYWGTDRRDLQAIAGAIQDDIIDRLVRANLDMWLERLEEDRAEEEENGGERE